MKAVSKENIQHIASVMGLRLPQVQLLLAQERFIARMSNISSCSSFIWKGGSLVLRAYPYLEKPRFTIDIDYLLRGLDISKVQEKLQEASALNLSDGFKFGSVSSTPMLRDTPYGGERFEISWEFNGKSGSQKLKLDICAGDVVEEVERNLDELSILEGNCEGFSVLVYPAEFIFAEKLQTSFKFGTGNTRLKDFIDMWVLIERGLDSIKVKEAIIKCFQRRESDFDLRHLQDVLNNQVYRDLLGGSLKKKFSALELPSINVMMDRILSFVAHLFDR